MSKRINVMLSDEMNEKLDSYSERYGVSKSSIVGFVVGQWMDNLERVNGAVFGLSSGTGTGAVDGILGNLFKGLVGNDKE